MSLKNYVFKLIAGTSLVAIIVFSLFSYQHFMSAGEIINTDRKESIVKLVQAHIENKKQLLWQSSKLLRKNNDLASNYLLSVETNDMSILEDSLLQIKRDLRLSHLSIKQSNKAKKQASYKVNKDTNEILHQSELKLFGDTVGYLILGVKIKDAGLMDIMRTTSSRINFGYKENINSANELIFVHEVLLGVSIRLEESPITAANINNLIVLILAGSFILFLFGVIILVGVQRGFINKIEELTVAFDRGAREVQDGVVPEKLYFESDKLFKEVNVIYSSYNHFIESLMNFKDTLNKQSKRAAMADMARQVAHDIRSPLSALEVGLELSELKNRDAEDLLSSAVKRIRNIANSLLETNKGRALREPINLEDDVFVVGSEFDNSNQKVKSNHIMISSIIESIMSEKELQYHYDKNIDFEWNNDSNHYGKFINFSPIKMKRILSNLINNSVESIEHKGTVKVKLEYKDSKIKIIIEDDGVGIPKSMMKRIILEGKSYKKPKGSGLGISYARKIMKEVGGKFRIYSKHGEGTRVELTVLEGRPPQWFVENIELKDKIIIIDDDPSVHKAWRARLSLLFGEEIHESIVHAYSPVDLKVKLNDIEQGESNIIYLMDYDFGNKFENGLETISRLGIFENTILVTNNVDDDAMRRKLRNLKVSLLPKSMLRKIPLSRETKLCQ